MRLRSGNVAGSASAAASETAPRRPAQLTTKVSRLASRGSRRAMIRRGELGSEARREDPDDARVTTTTAHTSATSPRISAGDRSRSPSRIAGSSRPMSTNTNPLRTNPIIFQLLSHRTRLLWR